MSEEIWPFVLMLLIWSIVVLLIVGNLLYCFFSERIDKIMNKRINKRINSNPVKEINVKQMNHDTFSV